MKKIILVCLFLVATFCFSRDIFGFDFKKPIELNEQYQELSKQGDNAESRMFRVNNVEFYDGASLETDKNLNIKSLHFEKVYIVVPNLSNQARQQIIEDYEMIARKLKREHGKFSIEGNDISKINKKYSSDLDFFNNLQTSMNSVSTKDKNIDNISFNIISSNQNATSRDNFTVYMLLMVSGKNKEKERVKSETRTRSNTVKIYR